MTALERETVLDLLSRSRQELKNLGVRKLALFGSVARNEARFSSDVDLLVECEPSLRPGLLYFTIQDDLSQLLNRKVDLNTPKIFKLLFSRPGDG